MFWGGDKLNTNPIIHACIFRVSLRDGHIKRHESHQTTIRIGMCTNWVFNYIKLLVELLLSRLIATSPLNPEMKCFFSQHSCPFTASHSLRHAMTVRGSYAAHQLSSAWVRPVNGSLLFIKPIISVECQLLMVPCSCAVYVTHFSKSFSWFYEPVLLFVVVAHHCHSGTSGCKLLRLS